MAVVTLRWVKQCVQQWKVEVGADYGLRGAEASQLTTRSSRDKPQASEYVSPGVVVTTVVWVWVLVLGGGCNDNDSAHLTWAVHGMINNMKFESFSFEIRVPVPPASRCGRGRHASRITHQASRGGS